mgnify:CR=1 FL=1
MSPLVKYKLALLIDDVAFFINEELFLFFFRRVEVSLLGWHSAHLVLVDELLVSLYGRKIASRFRWVEHTRKWFQFLVVWESCCCLGRVFFFRFSETFDANGILFLYWFVESADRMRWCHLISNKHLPFILSGEASEYLLWRRKGILGVRLEQLVSVSPS